MLQSLIYVHFIVVKPGNGHGRSVGTVSKPCVHSGHACLTRPPESLLVSLAWTSTKSGSVTIEDLMADNLDLPSTLPTTQPPPNPSSPPTSPTPIRHILVDSITTTTTRFATFRTSRSAQRQGRETTAHLCRLTALTSSSGLKHSTFFALAVIMTFGG